MKLRWEDMVNRSTVTLAALVLLLGVLLAARAMNPQQAQTAMREINTQITPQPAAKDVSQGDFFKDFRQQREQARADEVALLDGIVNREGAPEESVKEADVRKIELTRATEQERMIEKLLIAKGFEDAAAFVLQDTLTVAVKKAELEQKDTAMITELGMRCTGFEASQIKIVPVAPE